MADSGPTLSNLSTRDAAASRRARSSPRRPTRRRSWYAAADADREAFWAEQADRLHWNQTWDQVLDWQAPFAKWFVGGKLNVAYNCVDRHVEDGHGEQVAFHWEGEPGDTRTITYADLQSEVCKAANALTELGVGAGDRVAIQLPMIPEAVFSMLACARLGAMHSVVFGGFSPSALKARIEDAELQAADHLRRSVPAGQARADEGEHRRGRRRHPLHRARARRQAHRDRCAVDRRPRRVVARDRRRASPTPTMREPFDAEHPLFILYTSGTTGKPKGILHTSGGYLTQAAYTHHVVFDHKPGESVYWCTADIGWVTGHTYIVYGPLANRATSVMYEGTPNTPHEGRHWEIIQKYGVSIYYTAPTLIRTFMKWGSEIPDSYDLSSLRVLGSVGEPINPEAWMWYREHIGHDRCPIEDTWWQTETGAIMIAPLPGVTAAKPGSAMRPLPGISATVVNDEGEPVGNGGGGYLVLDKPWPAMLRGIWGDEARFRETYWSRFAKQGYYFAGDGAKYDDEGAIWLLGRVDDVMLVSGHNISTTEVESALVSHPTVAEAAVVGASDPTTGQGIVAFVILRGNAAKDGGEEAMKALRDHVAKEIGPIAKPRQIMVVEELPKTRSGKIMRRLLRDVAENREVGDVTTLADSSVMDLISAGLQDGKSED